MPGGMRIPRIARASVHIKNVKLKNFFNGGLRGWKRKALFTVYHLNYCAHLR